MNKHTRIWASIVAAQLAIIMLLVWVSVYFHYKAQILALDCGDFAVRGGSLIVGTPEEAMAWGNTDLDGDKDGVGCE